MHRQSIIALTLAAATLSGCGTHVRGADHPRRGLASVNQPVVSRTDYVFDVPASSYDGVSAADARRLEAWFRTLQLRYGDVVRVDDPQGNDPARRAAIAGVVSRYGLFVAEGAPITEGRIPDGNVRVIVSRSEAYVPNCPNWSQPSQPNFDQTQDSNFGCSTNSNLAAMIANPEDLIRGRDIGDVAEASTVAKGLTGYRTKAPTGLGGLKSESTGGK